MIASKPCLHLLVTKCCWVDIIHFHHLLASQSASSPNRVEWVARLSLHPIWSLSASMLHWHGLYKTYTLLIGCVWYSTFAYWTAFAGHLYWVFTWSVANILRAGKHSSLKGSQKYVISKTPSAFSIRCMDL